MDDKNLISSLYRSFYDDTAEQNFLMAVRPLNMTLLNFFNLSELCGTKNKYKDRREGQIYIYYEI